MKGKNSSKIQKLARSGIGGWISKREVETVREVNGSPSMVSNTLMPKTRIILPLDEG